jgi:hypothetical protein
VRGLSAEEGVLALVVEESGAVEKTAGMLPRSVSVWTFWNEAGWSMILV